VKAILAFQACISSMQFSKKIEDCRYERLFKHIENLKYQIFEGNK
jgi:hypothetical protein